MAHFAKIDENNVVLEVIVVHNNELIDETGNENESKGVAFCKSLFGWNTNWVQTSYNGNIRKNYAGIGYTYDASRDAFIAPQPFSSWVLNENNCIWEAPTPKPDDGKFYRWDEATTSWVEVVI
jgi:hypothetical protein